MPPLPRAQPTQPVPGQQVAPRTPLGIAVSGARASQQAARTSLQAAETAVRAGAVIGQLGQGVYQIGKDILEPFAKLAQAREITKANDILIKARLAYQDQVNSVLLSGAEPEQFIGMAEEHFQGIAKNAVEQAGAISPAATEFVERGLQKLHLSELTTLQKEGFRQSVSQRIAEIDRLQEDTERQYFSTHDPEERAELLANYERTVNAVTGTILSPQESQRRKLLMGQAIAVGTAVDLVRAGDFRGALEYVNRNPALKPSQKLSSERTVRAEMSAVRAEIDRQRVEEERRRKRIADAADSEFMARILHGENVMGALAASANILGGNKVRALARFNEHIMKAGDEKTNNVLLLRLRSIATSGGVSPDQMADTLSEAIEGGYDIARNDLMVVMNDTIAAYNRVQTKTEADRLRSIHNGEAAIRKLLTVEAGAGVFAPNFILQANTTQSRALLEFHEALYNETTVIADPEAAALGIALRHLPALGRGLTEQIRAFDIDKLNDLFEADPFMDLDPKALRSTLLFLENHNEIRPEEREVIAYTVQLLQTIQSIKADLQTSSAGSDVAPIYEGKNQPANQPYSIPGLSQ